jgi:hypothetical protein
MSKTIEKKTEYTPEHNLKRGITNRSVDCVRNYLSKESGKNVILSPESRKVIRAMLETIASEQDAKFNAVQTAFNHPKNWNADFVALHAHGKHIRVFTPIKKVQRLPKVHNPKAAVVAAVATPATRKTKAKK